MSNVSARPNPDRYDPIRPVLHDPEHLGYLLDHARALVEYLEGGPDAGPGELPVAFFNSVVVGAIDREVNVCFRVSKPDFAAIEARVRLDRTGPPKPFRRRGRR